MKSEVDKDIMRITEIMSQNSQKQLINEQEHKVLLKIIDEFIDPDDVLVFAKRFGFNLQMPKEKFLNNFTRLITILEDGSGKAWDAMISKAKHVEPVTKWKHRVTGEVVDNWEQTLSFEAVDGVIPFDDLTVYVQKIGDDLVEVSEDVYKQSVKDDELYHSLPSFFRAPYETIERRLKSELSSGAEDAIDTLPVFIKEMQLFFRDGTITKGLRLAIIRSLRDVPGFTMNLAQRIVKNPTVKSQIKAEKYFGDLDAYWKKVAKELQLDEGGSTMKTIKTYADDSIEGLLDYLKFLYKVPSIKAVGKSMIDGSAWKSFNRGARTMISDVALSGFWNYAMGFALIKPIIKRVRDVRKGAKLIKGDAPFKPFIDGAIAWLLIGTVKSIQHHDIAKGMDLFGIFTDIMQGIKGDCTGGNKVEDALTGKFYANATGADPTGENKPCKGNVILQPGFIDTFKLEQEVVDTKCKLIYNALHTKDDDENKWFWDTSDYIGFDIPTITKVILEWFNLYDPNRNRFKRAFFHTETLKTDDVGSRNMDIFKMSQIANTYELTYQSSLFDDAQKLNNWAKFFGREEPAMSFDDLKTAINKLPYLADDEADAAFKTYKNVVEENQKHIMYYPRYISKKIPGTTRQKKTDIRKCCQDGPCKCPGGCDLGGVMVGMDMVVELSKINVKKQEDLLKLTFEELKTAFDNVHNDSSISNQCWLNPNPKGASSEEVSWECQMNDAGTKGVCVEMTVGGTYSSLERCQAECGN